MSTTSVGLIDKDRRSAVDAEKEGVKVKGSTLVSNELNHT